MKEKVSLQEALSHPSALLVLVTGIPAAGKSAFLTACKTYLQTREAASDPTLGAAERVIVASILHIDDVIETLREEGAHRGGNASARDDLFCPLLWRRAAKQLLELTRVALRRALQLRYDENVPAASCDALPGPPVPAVFVEDNMHYRSMRHRYFRLCRAVEKESMRQPSASSMGLMAPAELPFIGILELRLCTPLSVCLKRNATRVNTRGVASGSNYVPPQVICSMHALFDKSHIASPEDGHIASFSGASGSCWRWTPTTQPWGLLELHEEGVSGDQRALPSPEKAAKDFLEISLHMHETRMEFRRQHGDLLRRLMLRKQFKEEEDGTVCSPGCAQEAFRTHAHQLDLKLRALIHTFVSQQWASFPAQAKGVVLTPKNQAHFQRSLASAKQKSLKRFKMQLRHLLEEEHVCSEEDAVAEPQCLWEARIWEVRDEVLDDFAVDVLAIWRTLVVEAPPSST